MAQKLGIEHGHFSAGALTSVIYTIHSLQPVHFSLLLQAVISPFPGFNPPQAKPA